MSKYTPWIALVAFAVVMFGGLMLFLSFLSAHPEADCIYGDFNPGNNVMECKPAPVEESR